MKVDNITSTNFGVISISDSAVFSCAKRLSEKNFVYGIPKLVNNHKNNPIRIRVSTIKDSKRLVCKVSIPKDNSDEILYEYSDKENILDRIFSNPLKYLKEVCRNANNIAYYLKRHN